MTTNSAEAEKRRFPFISQINVINSYAIQNLSIPDHPLAEIKHIILTGKNGSGKTSILNAISTILNILRRGTSIQQQIYQYRGLIEANPGNRQITDWNQEAETLEGIRVNFLHEDLELKEISSSKTVIAFFRSQRSFVLNPVDTVTKEEAFLDNFKQTTTEQNTALFKQFLVNKKVFEAFAFIDNKFDEINRSKAFFNNITQTFKAIFEDDLLELIFIQERFEFYIKLSDGRKFTFNQLPAGFSAFSSIVMTLLMQVDVIRQTNESYSIEPNGIILIDEPENHFHLSMQYQILPLLTDLFPNFQFLIATHSPAVISSLKNALVYDLTSRQAVADWLLGSSYSELMISHFGLENEFSPIADMIISEITNATKEKDSEKLKRILIENMKYLTPSLRFEIESQIAFIKSQQGND